MCAACAHQGKVQLHPGNACCCEKKARREKNSTELMQQTSVSEIESGAGDEGSGGAISIDGVFHMLFGSGLQPRKNHAM